MLIKQVQFRGVGESGEVFCQPLHTGLEKTAEAREASSKLHPQVQDFVKAVRPTKHGIYVLVNALGAGEYWGSNVNGDLFPEKALIHAPEGWDKMSVEKQMKAGPAWEWGFPTFLGAHPYKHHSNKDPSRAFGRVELSVWNPKMHRVELVVYLDRELCKKFDAYDVIERIERGEFPDVSMGCLPASARILRANGRYSAISEIKEGDEIISHKGRTQKVTSTMVRSHKGSIYTVKAYGMREPLVLTEEHPLWLVRKEQMGCRPSSKSLNKGRKQHVCTPTSFLDKRGCSGCNTRPHYKFDWVRTDEAREGDYLATPLPAFESNLDLSAHEARLLGYYLSEGHACYGVNGLPRAVVFSTNINETDTHDELFKIACALGAEPKFTWWDAEERHGRYIVINDANLAQLCVDHCGAGAKEKVLSTRLMGVDTDTLKLFLGAYSNGDGGAYKGSLYLSTASKELSEQLHLVLARCGMIASVNEIFHKPSKNSVVQKETIEYQVWVGTDTASRLTTSRLSLDSSIRQNSKRFFYAYEGTTYLMTPIESIEETPYDDNVYNFSVAEDESYVAEGLAVHNCKVPYDVCTICENKSKTRHDYCEHALTMMNKILPDGRKVAVRNDHPKFFDISFVFIGADKTAKVMAKLAQVGNQVCLGGFCAIPRPSAEVGERFSVVQPYDSFEDFFQEKVASTCCSEKTAMSGMTCPKCEHDQVFYNRGLQTYRCMDCHYSTKNPEDLEKNALIAEEYLNKAANGDMLQYFKDHPEKLKEKQERDRKKKEKTANDPIKKKVEVQGVPIWIEWKKGETRLYKKGNVVKYERLMKADYGYIPETKDADGEEIDVYLGPDTSAKTAYVIKQMKKGSGEFDENKVMVGYSSESAAKASYDYHMGGTKEFFGGINAVPVSALYALFSENGDGKEKVIKTASSTEKVCPCPKLGQSDCCASKDLTKFAAMVFPTSAEKSASHKKVSELIKSIPAGPFTKETLPKLEKTERDIPKDILDLMGGLPLGASCSTMGMLGMVLKPHEFQRVILVSVGEKPLADELDHENMTFGHSHDVDESIPIGDEHVDSRLKELLSLIGMLRDRSAATPALASRVSRSSEKSSAPQKTSDAPIMKKLAAAYNGYRRSLLKKANVIQQYLTTDPQLRADLFGGSMAEAFAGGVDKVATASVFGPDSLAYLVGAYTDRDIHLSSKETVESLALTGAVSETA